MSSSKDENELDGYTSKPYDLSQISGRNVNPASLGPLFGVPGKVQGPDYLEYNIAGRTAAERMVYNTGTLYLIGIFSGGCFGFVEGFRTSPSPKFNIRVNSILNKCGRRGSRLGNALASVAFLYSFVDWIANDWVQVDRYVPFEWASPVLCASITGMMYKSTQGPKTIAVAGGLGASIAASSFALKSLFPRKPGSSKRLLFF
jgi:import inner membrane translocase subunit TIM23